MQSQKELADHDADAQLGLRGYPDFTNSLPFGFIPFDKRYFSSSDFSETFIPSTFLRQEHLTQRLPHFPAITNFSQLLGGPSFNSLNSVLAARSNPVSNDSRYLSADAFRFPLCTISDRTR